MDLKSSRASSNDLSFNPDGSAVNLAAFQLHFREDSSAMAQLQQNDPWLAQAILGNDLEKLQNFLRERHLQRLEYKKLHDEELNSEYYHNLPPPRYVSPSKAPLRSPARRYKDWEGRSVI